MSYNVITGQTFRKNAKRLVKKYPSLKKELEQLASSLSLHPEQGTPLGNNTYKIRLAVRSKKSGKSGGMRIISYVVHIDKDVYLLTIYDKADFDSIDNKTIKNLIEALGNK